MPTGNHIAPSKQRPRPHPLPPVPSLPRLSLPTPTLRSGPRNPLPYPAHASQCQTDPLAWAAGQLPPTHAPAQLHRALQQPNPLLFCGPIPRPLCSHTRAWNCLLTTTFFRSTFRAGFVRTSPCTTPHSPWLLAAVVPPCHRPTHPAQCLPLPSTGVQPQQSTCCPLHLFKHCPEPAPPSSPPPLALTPSLTEPFCVRHPLPHTTAARSLLHSSSPLSMFPCPTPMLGCSLRAAAVIA